MAVALHPVNSGPFAQAGTLARVPIGGGAPREVIDDVTWADWTPDGQSLAVIRTSNTSLGHLEFPAGNVIYEPDGWVSHVRFSPDGNFLAIADHVRGGDDGRVVIIDRQGNRKASSSYFTSVEGLAWAVNGKELWFSAIPSGAARSIYALDLSGKERLIFRGPGGLTLHDISRTGLVLLTSDKSRLGISALAPGESHERSLSWFDWSLLTDMSHDGKTIVFSESGEAVGSNNSVYLRKTDGSPAIRLGEGSAAYLSPDGQWVIAAVGNPVKVMLIPTGVGEPKMLVDPRVGAIDAGWLPDSKSIVYTAHEPGGPPRAYLLAIDGGTPRPITPQGVAGNRISPDGRFLLALDDKSQRWLYPLAGGDPQKLNLGLNPNERIMGFFDDKTLLARTRTVPVEVTRIDIATGHREPFKEIAPADPAGVISIPTLRFSTDGKSYAYSVGRLLSDLYVVEGLK